MTAEREHEWTVHTDERGYRCGIEGCDAVAPDELQPGRQAADTVEVDANDVGRVVVTVEELQAHVGLLYAETRSRAGIQQRLAIEKAQLVQALAEARTGILEREERIAALKNDLLELEASARAPRTARRRKAKK